MRNTIVVDMMEQNASYEYWEKAKTFYGTSLQANSCQSALALANHDQQFQNYAFEIGKNFSLAWHAFNELQPFLEPSNSNQFDLWSAPVLLHFERNKDMGTFRTVFELCDWKVFCMTIKNYITQLAKVSTLTRLEI